VRVIGRKGKRDGVTFTIEHNNHLNPARTTPLTARIQVLYTLQFKFKKGSDDLQGGSRLRVGTRQIRWDNRPVTSLCTFCSVDLMYTTTMPQLTLTSSLTVTSQIQTLGVPSTRAWSARFISRRRVPADAATARCVCRTKWVQSRGRGAEILETNGELQRQKGDKMGTKMS